MQEPNQIWEFGRWIARRDPGVARLTWSGGETVLGVSQGRIHSADGLDPNELSRRLARGAAGETELLAEARALSLEHQIPETQAMGTAKEILQEALRQWLMDPDRAFAIDDGEPDEVDGATISITHALVELVLADTTDRLSGMVLPSSESVIQRSGAFLELYAPLRLSEEADLIVASITGSSTAADIERESVHNADEVMRLVAALVATGVLEASEPVLPAQDLDWSGADLDDGELSPRKIPVWMIGAAAAALVIVIAIAAFFLLRGDDGEDAAVLGSGDWGVVIEMGCEPQDLQRMLRKRNQEPKSFRTVMTDPTNGSNCVRLVWGSFATQAAAEAAMEDIPSNLVEEGFEPHIIEVADDEGETGVEG